MKNKAVQENIKSKVVTLRDKAHLWEDSVIESCRFASRTDRFLSQAGLDFESCYYFSDGDQLREQGVNVTELAICLQQQWLTPVQVSSTLKSQGTDGINALAASTMTAMLLQEVDADLLRKGLQECWLLWMDVEAVLGNSTPGELNEILLQLQEIHAGELSGIHNALQAACLD